MKRLLTPVSVTLLGALLVLSVVLARAGWDPFELVRAGTQFSEGVPDGTEGYDGQFFYYIARDPDPQRVAPLLDVPAYRYQRILVPLLARAASLGNPAWLPWMLPLVGLAAHLGGVHLLSRLFERWGANRWYALGYGLLLGCLLSIRLALPETLAFALVIAAVWLEQNKRSPLAWLCFSLAIFAKETAAFFALAQGLSYLFARRGQNAVSLAAAVGLPQLVFRLWMLDAFGSMGFGLGGFNATGLELFPFYGWWRVGEHDSNFRLLLGLLYLPTIFLPALWGLAAAARAWLRDRADFSALALFANAAIFPFMSLALYVEPYGSIRLAVGLQLAALLFAARHGVRRVLAYGLLYILLDVWLFAA